MYVCGNMVIPMSKVVDLETERLKRDTGTWNYRVVRRYFSPTSLPQGGIWSEQEIYSIAEVHYDYNGDISSFVTYFEEENVSIDLYGLVKQISPFGTSIDELRGDIKKMLEAFNKPILDYDFLISLDK